MTRFKKLAGTTTIAAIGCLALAGPAPADTVVMGSPLVTNYEGGVSSGASTTSVQLSFSPLQSSNPVVSPANGLITGWKVKSADDGAIYTLKVLRPNGAVSLVTTTNTNFAGVGSVQAPTAVPAGTNVATPTGLIFDYPASLPISKGDYVGLVTGGDDDDLPQANTNGAPQNLIANNFSAQPVDGTSANLLADAQHELLLQATIKFCKVPNLKGKKAKAAKKALVNADCAAKVGKKGVKKDKQVGKVVAQKKKAGFTAPPGTQIAISVGK